VVPCAYSLNASRPLALELLDGRDRPSAVLCMSDSIAYGVYAACGELGFTVPGERDAVFAKVGDALGGIAGATIASRAQLLGTYDVDFEGSKFLVRVTKTDAGVYVSAVDPRGLPAAGEAPVKLMAALKTALGG